MKKTITLFLLALVCSFSAQAQWHQLLPSSSNVYNRLSFPSDDTGYAIAGKVFRTFNGGTSFDSVSVPGIVQYSSIRFRTKTEGAVCGYGSAPYVYRTFTAGTTWNNVTPGSVIGAPSIVQFNSLTKGIFLTSAPWIYKTDDGGLTWDTLSFGYDYFNDVSFPDSLTGYLAGFDGTFNYKGAVAKTTDGGVTWSLLPAFTELYTEIAQLQFVHADTGFAVGSYQLASGYPIFRTVDGGQTWDTVFFRGYVSRIAFLNHNIGFLVTDTGTVWRTTDGGVTWPFDYQPMGYFVDVCVTPHYAYGGGSPGQFFKRDWLSAVAENHSSKSFSIYPVPASNEINISGEPTVVSPSVEVFDVNGNLIRSGVSGGTIYIADLAPGVYFLRFANGESRRFVKE